MTGSGSRRERDERPSQSFQDKDVLSKVETTLNGRTALITGGGIGIGQAIALALAEAGATIAVTYRTHAPDDEFAGEVEQLTGSPLTALRLEATSETATREVSELLGEALGPIDILVNNVGGLVQRAELKDMSYQLWREVMAVNLDSMFLITRQILPLITNGDGRIINVASLAGRNGGHAGAVAYATAKAAIFGFTRGLSKEIAADGITVNALAPGFIEATPFHDTFTTTESKRATIQTIPVGRAGIPSDVASAAVWLSGRDTGFVTGAVIDINGGQYFG